MSKQCDIIHKSTGRVVLSEARWCDSFFSKLRGYMFTRTIETTDALVLVDKRDSKLNSSIHMMFMNFDLAVIWVNDAGQVVDKVLAKRWRPNYSPQAAARYVIETHPHLIDQFEIGDEIEFQVNAV